MNRVGWGCLEAVQTARCNNLVMETERKTRIGMFHIASLESIRVQVSIRIPGREMFFAHEMLIPFQETQFAKAGRAPAGKI